MKRVIFDSEHEQFRDSVRKFMQAEVLPTPTVGARPEWLTAKHI
jgi:hypothetical protein